MSGNPKYPIKDCGEEIKEQDLDKVIEATREYGNLSDGGELLLRTAASYIRCEAAYFWKNAKIAVFGPDLQLVFVSGYQSHQIVVTLDNNDDVNSFCEEKGWKRMTLQSDDVTTAIVWGDIRGTLTDRLMTLLIDLILDDVTHSQVISPKQIQKSHAVGLRARKNVPNGTGKTLHDVDKNGEVTKEQIKRGQWTERGECKRRSYKRVVFSACLGCVVLVTATLVFLYGV